MGKQVFTSNSEDWYTPSWIYNLLNKRYNFTLDPCATKESAKTTKYFTKQTDGLKQDWSGNVVFVNPPYGKVIYDWVKKCYEESLKPDTTVIMLIPAHTDTKYFHDYIFKYAKEISFIKSRLKFETPQSDGTTKAGVGTTFPSVVIRFQNNKERLKINTIEKI